MASFIVFEEREKERENLPAEINNFSGRARARTADLQRG